MTSIKNRRIELGLTQDQVSDAVGVSSATLSRWESGDIKNMKSDKVHALAKVLQVSELDILGVPYLKSEIKLSDEELDLVIAYRNADPLLQHAVNKLLDLPSKTRAELLDSIG